ncbi:acyl-CoA dehydrogenase, mitochondrial precursor [Sugiyamaella lignohabitans]|uniref:Short/branched chain specific acyl-CoA dehydrogenase, mitochondrial n=1 Tax=Sugiyamaella lignohabitans TaxID=796027 RepID=A0A167CWX1_9ASCO|nr:acyl-CoA dehydrogenase, mitochondrial precursor [Sugiyamaella lignohabitans]ANB12204.1 acyl-CoA dehydrogenase, mitochondrial precursor [Sugiyamaella lignohabitans]
MLRQFARSSSSLSAGRVVSARLATRHAGAVTGLVAGRAVSRGIHSLNTFTEEEDLFRESVSKFAEEVVAPKVREMDENEAMDPAIVQAMFDNGLMGIETPEEFGGAGASFTSAILVVEELAKVDPSVSVLNDVHNTLVNTTIRTFGSDALKEKYLPLLASGKVGSFCLSEASSGSDAFALKSKATKNADGDYVLTGSKMWITNSAEAEIFVILANLDPSQGYKGITAFVVEKDMGVQIAKKEKKLGIKASSTCVLHFDDIVVPKENLLGEEGKGYKIAIECLNEGRIGIAAQMTGLAQGAFNRATDYIFNDRKQFNKLIGEFQGVQFQVAQAATDIEASRLLLYNAARLKEEGKPFVKEAAMAKLYASQMAQRVSSAAVDWMGGVGFTREDILEKFYRDSKIGTIYEGTTNIQLQTIAKLIQKERTQ